MDEGEAREGGGEEEEENVYQRSFEYNDDYGAHDWNDYEGGGEEVSGSFMVWTKKHWSGFEYLGFSKLPNVGCFFFCNFT